MTPEIVAGGIYYDAKISRPERLVYELVSDGLRANEKSLAANATTLVSTTDGLLTFQRSDGYAFSVKPKLVVNAAGPWIDHINAALGAPSHLIGGTKGSHILLDHPELVRSLNGHMIYFEADDGRICLVYGYLGQALVGSTDIPCDDPDNVRCEEPEIEYFLDSVRSLLPGLRFERDQVTYSYSGIRPLPASDASAPGLISRDHSAPAVEAQTGRPFPIISLVGGKWTTFRGFAEEVADTVLKRLQRPRKTSTERLAIGGGLNFPASSDERATWIRSNAAKTGAEASRVDELLSRYGTTAAAILAHRSDHADSRRISGAPRHSALEIDWIARQELVVHLSDIVFRRTTLAIEGLLTMQGLHEIGAIVAASLQWDAQRLAKEIDDVVAVLSKFHGQTLTEESMRRAASPAAR